MSNDNDAAPVLASLFVVNGLNHEEVTITWPEVLAKVASVAPRFFLERHSSDSFASKILINESNELPYKLLLKPFGLTYQQYLLPWTDAAVRAQPSEVQRAVEKMNILPESGDDADGIVKKQEMLALHHRIDDYYDAVLAWRRQYYPRSKEPEVRICTSGLAQKAGKMALEQAKAIWLGGRDVIQNFDITFEQTMFTYFSLKLAEEIGVQLRRLETLFLLAVGEEIRKAKDKQFRTEFVNAWHKSSMVEDLYLCTHDQMATWRMVVERFKKLKARSNEFSDRADTETAMDSVSDEPDTRNDVGSSEANTEIDLREMEGLEGDETFYPPDWFNWILAQAARMLDENEDDPWGMLYPWSSCHDCQDYDDQKMIECEGYHETRTWFHFACAQIKKVPKNRWICRPCKAAEAKMEAQHSAKATIASVNTVRLRDVEQQSPSDDLNAIPEAVGRGEERTQYSSNNSSRALVERPRARRIVESSFDEADDEDEDTPRSSARVLRARAQPVQHSNSTIAERVKLGRMARESATHRAQTQPSLDDWDPPSVSSTSESSSVGELEDASPSVPPASANTIRIANLVKEGSIKRYSPGPSATRSQSVSIVLPFTKAASRTPLVRRTASSSYHLVPQKMQQQPANLNALRGDLAGILDTKSKATPSGPPHTEKLGAVIGAWRKGEKMPDQATVSAVLDGERKRHLAEEEYATAEETPESASKKPKLSE
ncbi:hypothetical protein BU16DRAFT_612555 [Lophium mytilinum]|uniref:PHD-type domain-containing protein n=1 Tax=Lophium mytilinum TaxID=390894 RepID=A0A6A6RHP0_9PEZI|nr:hypothetical protein BU16DRAFT_612555 [Lophium mytilinum]